MRTDVRFVTADAFQRGAQTSSIDWPSDEWVGVGDTRFLGVTFTCTLMDLEAPMFRKFLGDIWGQCATMRLEIIS